MMDALFAHEYEAVNNLVNINLQLLWRRTLWFQFFSRVCHLPDLQHLKQDQDYLDFI